MRYTGPLDEWRSEVAALGLAMSSYFKKNVVRTVMHIRSADSQTEGHGPEQRLIRVKYERKPPPENIVHEIKISDPVEEDRLEREIRVMYGRYNFSII